jgi:hypothetical protein
MLNSRLFFSEYSAISIDNSKKAAGHALKKSNRELLIRYREQQSQILEELQISSVSLFICPGMLGLSIKI